MSFSVETMKEIWDDGSGCKIQIGPDRDGLDLLEIRSFSPDGKVEARMTFSKEQAKLVATAINDLANG